MFKRSIPRQFRSYEAEVEEGKSATENYTLFSSSYLECMHQMKRISPIYWSSGGLLLWCEEFSPLKLLNTVPDFPSSPEGSCPHFCVPGCVAQGKRFPPIYPTKESFDVRGILSVFRSKQQQIERETSDRHDFIQTWL